MSNKYIDAAEIRRTITTLKDPGELFEIRAIGSGRPKVLSGYFTDTDKAIRELERLNLSGRNVFITLNEIDRACYSREQRDVFLEGRTTTSDDDITGYKWLLADFDPVRRSGVSSSDAELSEAKDLARNVVKYGRELGLPEPVVSMSGNGCHVLYKLDIPNTVETRQLIERTLKAFDLMYSTDTVKVDTSVFNPSRISKLYGTVAQKGASSDERPHRMSRIVQVPDQIEPVPVELLREIASVFPEQDRARRDTKAAETTRFDVYDLLNKNGVRYTEKTGNGYTKLILDECIFDSSHKAPDSMITISDSGALGYKCLHNSCSCYKWQDVRIKLDPTAYDTPAPTRTRETKTVPDRQNYVGLPRVISVEDIQEVDAEWLIEDVMPRGQISIWGGDGGEGKGFVVCDAIAGLTTGRPCLLDMQVVKQGFTDYSQLHVRDPATVLYLSGEDSFEVTLRRRLRKAGADMTRVLTMNFTSQLDANITTGSAALEQVIETYRPDLLVLDPLESFLDESVKMSERNAMRQSLRPLLKYGEQYGLTTLIVAHSNKGKNVWGRKRLADSSDLWDIARSVFLLGRTPDKHRYMSHEKSNYGPLQKTIIFDITPDERVSFVDYSELTDRDYVLAATWDTQGKSTRTDAKDIILDALRQATDPIPVAEIDELAEAIGLSGTTLKRAKTELKKDGVIKFTSTGNGKDKRFYISLV